MPQIFKDATITKTKSRRPAADAKMVTRRLTAEIFGILVAPRYR